MFRKFRNFLSRDQNNSDKENKNSKYKFRREHSKNEKPKKEILLTDSPSSQKIKNPLLDAVKKENCTWSRIHMKINDGKTIKNAIGFEINGQKYKNAYPDWSGTDVVDKIIKLIRSQDIYNNLYFSKLHTLNNQSNLPPSVRDLTKYRLNLDKDTTSRNRSFSQCVISSENIYQQIDDENKRIFVKTLKINPESPESKGMRTFIRSEAQKMVKLGLAETYFERTKILAPSNKKWFIFDIILPYRPNCQYLFSFINNFYKSKQINEDDLILLLYIALNTAKAVSYFHEKGWVNLNITADAFLIDDNGVHLTDLEKARLATSVPNSFYWETWSLEYTAQEILNNEPIKDLTQADIYSLGKVLATIFNLIETTEFNESKMTKVPSRRFDGSEDREVKFYFNPKKILEHVESLMDKLKLTNQEAISIVNLICDMTIDISDQKDRPKISKVVTILTNLLITVENRLIKTKEEQKNDRKEEEIRTVQCTP